VTTALLRYLAADALRSQRWAAPLLAFLAAVAIISPSNSAPLLPTLTMSAAALLPTSLWLTVVVNNSEDPVQTHITGVIVGAPQRVRRAKLATAYLGSVALALPAIAVVSVATSDHVTLDAVAAGTLEHLTTALAGVSLGALVSRPVLTRTGWTVLAGTGVCLAELLVPHFPPVHALLAAFGDHAPPNPWPTVGFAAGQTVLLAGLAIAAAHTLSRART
jgi:hypothetical protein